MSPLCLLARQSELRAGMVAPDAWLSAGECNRLQAFGSTARRDSFLAGRWLARQAVQGWRGGGELPALEVTSTGVPLPVDGGLCLSISHSGDWVAAAVGEGPLGLDIEDAGRPRDFAALAAALWPQRAVEPWDAVHFLREWTLREAWAKAHGQGLFMPGLRELQFSAHADGDTAHAVVDTLVLAVATPGRRCEPRLAERLQPAWVQYQSTPKS